MEKVGDFCARYYWERVADRSRIGCEGPFGNGFRFRIQSERVLYKIFEYLVFSLDLNLLRFVYNRRRVSSDAFSKTQPNLKQKAQPSKIF